MTNSNERNENHSSEKTPLQVFIDEIGNIGKGNNIKDISLLYKKLDKGFEGEKDKLTIEKIYQVLAERDEKQFQNLGLFVGINITTQKKKKELLNKLYRLIQNNAFMNVAFPSDVPLYVNYVDEARYEKIENWISENKENKTLSCEIIKNALVCLIHPNMQEYDILLVNKLINEYLTLLRKQSKTSSLNNRVGQSCKNYLTLIRNAMLAKKFPHPKFNPLLEITGMIEKITRKVLKDNREKASTICGLQEEIDRTIIENKKLEETKSKNEREILKLQKELLEKEKELKEAEAFYIKKKKEWADETSRIVKGELYQVKRFLEHELETMKYALKEEPPNLSVLNYRIANIKEFISKRTGEDE